jgi:serine protease Do
MWMQNYITQGAGSGVIIQSDGYIITCEHVIEGARKITVTLRDGTEYDAELVGADAANDIAVIKIKAKGLQEATYGDSSKLVVGDQVIAIGNPLGTLSGTATTGIISALNRNLNIDNRTLNLFQTDASINPGNSGGGMFDMSGNLIGIVEAKSTGSDIDGLGFATPINKAAKIAKEIIKTGGSIKSEDKSGSIPTNSVIIGIMVAPVDNQTAMQYGYRYGGLLIKQVTSDEANKAGLQVGDIIYEADGTAVSNNDQLYAILAKKKAGDKLKLSIARDNGQTTTVTTTLISNDSSH